MSLQACADIVAKGDPDRFAAAMAVPVPARRVLFPLYAFNVEVARAPWAASEPMIGEMRLQWWRDMLESISDPAEAGRHEVAEALAGVIDESGAEVLDRLVAARRWDLYRDAFEDAAHFDTYLEDTGGGLMWVAARALGGQDEKAFRTIGKASALANLLLAIPELEARGRRPLFDGRPEAVGELAALGLTDLREISLPRNGRPAAVAAWRAKAILSIAAKAPHLVAEGRLGESEFRKRLSLLWASVNL